MSEVTTHQAIFQLRLLYREIGRRRRQQLGCLLVLMLTSSMAEVITLAAAIPFLAIISGQSGGIGHQLFVRLAFGLGLSGMRQRLLLIAVGFGSVVLLATALRLACQYFSALLAGAIGTDLSGRIYGSYMLRAYSEQLSQRRDSSQLIANVMIFANQASGTIYFLLQFLLSSLLVVGLLSAGLLADWRLTLSAISVVGATYGAINITNLPRLRRYGHQTSQATQLLTRTLEEAIHRSKSIILDGSASAHLDRFRNLDGVMRRSRSRMQFLSLYPRALAEGVILLTIAALGFFCVMQSRAHIATLIPLLGTLVLGFQKLLPAIQMMYSSWAGIVSNAPAVHQVLTMMAGDLQQNQTLIPLGLNKSLRLEHVGFHHSTSRNRLLHDVSLHISVGETVGLIGLSGVGKSTLADLLMGLLPPNEGDVLVDGLRLYDSDPRASLASRWQRSIAYVPSAVYLLPASIAENIHCSIDSTVDIESVKMAANIAHLGDFISQLPNGYDTRIGSGGLSISHGQSQRIGLARAVLQPRPMLVLDEATAALDLQTEQIIMSRLRQFKPTLTIVLITHRHESLVHCNRVYRLHEGRVSLEASA